MGRIGKGWRRASETSYEITFSFKSIRCRERIKIKPSTTNDKRIANHLGAILNSIENNTFDYNITFPNSCRKKLFLDNKSDDLLIEEYFDSWLEMKRKCLKSSTITGYAKIINHQIIPRFLGIPINKIKRSDLRNWLSQMDCSNKNLSNIQSVFRTAMQDAFSEELIESNPLYGWVYKNNEAPKKDDDVEPFSAQEQNLILNNLLGQNRNMIQFFFWSGLRTSELVALNWDDIDWLRGEVDISKALTQSAIEFESTKTYASKRKVKLLAPALSALEDQKQFTILKNCEIFQNPRTLERWTGDQSIRKTAWHPALKRAGVKYRRPYQTRHTYASMMLSAGESIAWLAQQMGHTDWDMLRRIYAKFIKDSIPDAGQKAVQMFGQNAGIKAGNRI
jgi:integrase